MDRDIKTNGLINVLVMLVITVASVFIARLCHALSAQPTLVFLGLGVAIAAVSYFQMRLEESERLERLEVEELRGSTAAGALFSQEADIFPAARSREQFERWFVPTFSFLLMTAQIATAWWLWQKFSAVGLVVITQGAVAMALFGIFALILFLLGKYSASLTRIEGQRLLRPAASYLLLGAYLTFAVTACVAASELGFPKVDIVVAKALAIILGLTGLETLINLVFEIYRPRVKGHQARLLYESRLIGLLGQPEGLITTAAQALDYQFGFKVSDTWLYRFLEKALAWIILLQLGVLFASTTFVIIEPNEQALLERFGRPVAGRGVLEPGIHFKWPWPVDKIHRHHTREVQTFTIGVAPDPGLERERTLIWTKPHSKEEFNLLVASREHGGRASSATPGVEQAVPVNLLSVSIPVQYQVTNLIAWYYNHSDANELLQKAATREVIRYLVNVDIEDLMTAGRFAASEGLRQRIQSQADTLQLGAYILLVGLQDIHPPIGTSMVKVAEAYEAVVGAMQERETNILAARAYFAEKVPLAHAEATNLLSIADSERAARISTAAAEASLFTNQLAAYRAAPEVYLQRTYLETLIRATATSRKYIIGTSNTHEIIWLNLEEKIRTDLLDVTLPTDNKK